MNNVLGAGDFINSFDNAAKVAKYINVLINLGFIKKEVPCGEKEKSKACLDRTYLLATDDENAVICECKYTEDPFDEKQLKDLIDSALFVRQPNKTFVIFSRNGISSGVEKIIKDDSSYTVIGIKELFEK